MTKTLSKKEAIQHLDIEEKEFENYQKYSGEIKGTKIRGRWYYNKQSLDSWKRSKDFSTVLLSRDEYEKCFVFAIQMAYSKSSSAGTGIRGVRSEMQQADDWILGILAEFGLKKFLKKKFKLNISLDTEPHPNEITAQDIILVDGKEPGIKVAVKSSKPKSCFNVIPPIEYEEDDRKSDVYVFARVYLPSDHLFRILRDHLFFRKARGMIEKKVNKQEDKILKANKKIQKLQNEIQKIDDRIKMTKSIKDSVKRSKTKKELQKPKKLKKDEIKIITKNMPKLKIFNSKIKSLPKKIPVWICGYSNHKEMDKRKEIPGQKFSDLITKKNGKKIVKDYRYVKSVADMKNSHSDWDDFVGRLTQL